MLIQHTSQRPWGVMCAIGWVSTVHFFAMAVGAWDALNEDHHEDQTLRVHFAVVLSSMGCSTGI